MQRRLRSFRFPLAVPLACAIALSACVQASPPPATPEPRASTADAPASGEPNGKHEETVEERESRQLGRTWGIVAVGLGGIAGAVAIGTSILMLQDLSQRHSDCNPSKVCTSDGISANDALSDLAPWNTTTWILAVVGGGIGAYLLIANPTDRSMGVQVGVAPNGSGAGLNARGSF